MRKKGKKGNEMEQLCLYSVLSCEFHLSTLVCVCVHKHVAFAHTKTKKHATTLATWVFVLSCRLLVSINFHTVHG